MNSQKKENGRRNDDRREDVAIVGMACLFPGAPDLDTYWYNISSGQDWITDPPSSSWDVDVHFDPDSRENDRIYCKKGGYLGDLAEFDPLQFGIPPLAVKGGEPEQWLALRVAREALVDAGLADGVPQPERTAVILGKGDYVNRGNLSLLQHHGFVDQTLDIIRSLNPELSEDDLLQIKRELKSGLPPFNPDTVPALVPNIAAGRIANRLDLMGPSYTIDAACASSLIAVDTAVQELRAGRCDMALVGGMHVALPMLLRQVFCQLEALSPLQKIRPFDKSADGTILGEGIGMAVLERRSDAERAGRRTYALIKGVGTASDGQGMSVMAPRLDGEILALRRAYEGSGVSPDSVGLIEAHGTGTPVGDATEIEALTAVFGERSSRFPRCAVGTVKSMIGHLMPAAGMAALIKTALALHHKVLPQTLNVTEPLEAFESGTTPFYVNGTTRPWIRGREAGPRRAGINAFGFGGINAHVILEEHDGDVSGQHRPARWESEAVVLSAASRNALAGRGRELLRSIETHPQMRLRDLAFTLNRAAGEGPFTLALVATSPGDLAEKLEGALEKIADPGCRRIKNVRRGIYFFEEQLGRSGKLAFLFPGEGSQYRGMLADLCTAFPEVRPRFEITESGFARAGISESPSDYIFPPSNCSDEQRAASDAWLSHMRGAVAAVLTSDYAVLTLLRELQIRPDALVGHSTGEFAALVASGIVDIEDDGRAETYAGELHEVFQTLEQSDLELPPAMLVAIGGDSATVLEILGESGGAIQIAMDNCPHQSVIVGDPEIVREAVKKLQKRGLICETLPFDRPYHTPQFAPLARTVREFLDRWVAGPPRVETYTCATKAPFPEDREEILDLAAEQWVRPVAFRETVEAMYDDGVRLFVEVGARGNLTAFVDDILRGRTHAAVAADLETRSGISQLNHLVATLAAHGVPMNLGALYEGRGAQAIDLESSDDPSSKPGVSATRLETGWPVMRLSDETLARIREKTGRRREREAVMRQPAQHATGPTGAPAAVDSGAPAAGSTVTRQGVVAAHLRSMERFLQLNQDVMQSYLGRGGSAPAASAGRAPAAVATPTPAIANLPLAGRLVSHEPGREAVVRRDLDPDLDLFLRDHTFGRRVSRTDPDLLGVTVMPLTVSMEMMAEVASHVTGGGTLIGMKDVRGLRWIAAEGGRIPLEIVARRLEEAGPGEVRVQIFEAERPGAEPRGFSVPLIEGTMVFGRYPKAIEAETDFRLENERSSTWAPDRLYEDVMFHEPLMQGVASMDAIGSGGARATLLVLPRERLFRDTGSPRFLTDPILLDQVGQVAGFWAKEYWKTDVFFPFYVSELELFGPPLPTGEKVECRARISVVGDDQISADLDVVRSDGTLWTRVRGWQDRRFEMPNTICSFFLSPGHVILSEPVEPADGAGLPSDAVTCRLPRELFPGDFFTGAGGVWRRSFALALLSKREREEWGALQVALPRQVDWLLARAAAKDAARIYLERKDGLELCPADIELRQVRDGLFSAHGPWAARRKVAAIVRVAERDGGVVATCHDES